MPPGIDACQGSRGVATVLADEFYLIAHEERTGRSRLHPRATGLGLAAGLLGELMLLGRVRAYGGELYVVSHEPPGDSLAHNVLDLLVVQRRHRELRTWLAFLAQDAAVWVAERLIRAGVVEPVTRRKLRGTQTVYMPMNSRQRTAAAWAPMRLANVLVQGRTIDIPDRVLAGLVLATGLTRHVLWDFEAHRSGLTTLYAVVESLPTDLRELIEHTEASVGSVLAAGRR
jgi:Golgi phosphoprotein 3 (GPP34)